MSQRKYTKQYEVARVNMTRLKNILTQIRKTRPYVIEYLDSKSHRWSLIVMAPAPGQGRDGIINLSTQKNLNSSVLKRWHFQIEGAVEKALSLTILDALARAAAPLRIRNTMTGDCIPLDAL